MKEMFRMARVLFVSVMMFVVAGCEDTNKDDLTGGDIRGTWYYSEAWIEQDFIQISVTETIGDVLPMWSSVTFAGATETGGIMSGSYHASSGSGTFEGAWSASDNQLTVTYDGNTQVFTYGISGDTLTLYAETDYTGISGVLVIKFTR